jgi:DHA1 family tetracycline resistance protein-like MFS transporter
MQFASGPFLGMLSDRFGRRPVILVSVFGLFVDFLFMAFAPSLAWLFVGRMLNGLTAATFSTTNAYVADITAPENRARRFGMLGSAFGLGFMIGPTVGGVFSLISLRAPFMVAAALCAVNLIYGYIVLPESLPVERRVTAFKWSRANPLGSMVFLNARRDLIGLAGIGFLSQLAQSVLPSVFVLYTGYRYHWTPSVLGWAFMASGACMIFVQVVLVAPIVKRLGERGAVLTGAAFGTTGLVMYGLAGTPYLYCAAIPVFSLMVMTSPGVMGLMSRRVGPSQQGQMQGVNQSFQGIASIIGPIVFGLTFAFAVRRDATLHLPGLPILIAAGLYGTALLIALKVAKPAAAPEGFPSPLAGEGVTK